MNIFCSMYGASGAAPREARGRGRAGDRPDVLPAPADTTPADLEPQLRASPGKDSVARLTLTGVSFVFNVSELILYRRAA